jgi:hypothetical protein
VAITPDAAPPQPPLEHILTTTSNPNLDGPVGDLWELSLSESDKWAGYQSTDQAWTFKDTGVVSGLG